MAGIVFVLTDANALSCTRKKCIKTESSGISVISVVNNYRKGTAAHDCYF